MKYTFLFFIVCSIRLFPQWGFTNPLLFDDDNELKIAAYFQDSTVTTASNPGANNLFCFKITTGTNSGILTAYRFYSASSQTGKHIKFCLYNNNGTAPGSLVANSISNEITTTSTGLNTVAITNGALIQANTIYWIGYMFSDGTMSIAYTSTTGSNTRYIIANTYSNGFPDPCTGGGTSSNRAAIGLGIWVSY